MSRFKKFSAGRSIDEFEPLGFELNGEQFECFRAVQGSVLLKFVRDAASGDGAASAGALYDFLKAAMPVDEYARLDSMLNNPEVIIDVEEIGEVVSWLVSEMAGRPTQQPEDSSTGQLTSGPSSTDVQRSTAAN